MGNPFGGSERRIDYVLAPPRWKLVERTVQESALSAPLTVLATSGIR